MILLVDNLLNFFYECTLVMLSRNRVQMWYKKSYWSNRESKQRTCAMIVLVERYCKTCMFSLSIYKLQWHLYVHSKNALQLFYYWLKSRSLLSYWLSRENDASSLTTFVFRLISDHFLITTERIKKKTERKQ